MKEFKFVPHAPTEKIVDRVVSQLNIRVGSKLEDLMRPGIRACFMRGMTEKSSVEMYKSCKGFAKRSVDPEWK